MSYEFELYFQAEQIFGVYDNKTGTWIGEVQDILTGKGDLVADLGLFPSRSKVLDSSQGYLLLGFNVLTKLGKNNVSKKSN